jgi:hypothetical protein
MGQVLSRPDWIDELEEEQEQSSEETNESIDNPDLYIEPEAVDRHEDKCQICHNDDIYNAIMTSCDSQYNHYILCSSCHYDLYGHNDTLIECQYCGNLWDGYAQCHCYHEENDDM